MRESAWECGSVGVCVCVSVCGGSVYLCVCVCLFVPGRVGWWVGECGCLSGCVCVCECGRGREAVSDRIYLGVVSLSTDPGPLPSNKGLFHLHDPR